MSLFYDVSAGRIPDEKDHPTRHSKRWEFTYQNLTPSQINIIRLGTSLEAYGDLLPKVSRESLRSEMANLPRIGDMNMRYLAAALVVLANIDSKIKPTTTVWEEPIWRRVEDILRSQITASQFDIVSAKQEMAVYMDNIWRYRNGLIGVATESADIPQAAMDAALSRESGGGGEDVEPSPPQEEEEDEEDEDE